MNKILIQKLMAKNISIQRQNLMTMINESQIELSLKKEIEQEKTK